MQSNLGGGGGGGGGRGGELYLGKKGPTHS